MRAAPVKVVSRASSSTKASNSRGEPRELAGPLRADLAHRAVRELHPRDAHLEHALVLEEVQVPVGLGYRVMHRVLTGLPRHGEAAADLEVDADIELSLALIEVHPCDEPGTADAQSRLEDLLCDHCNQTVYCEATSYRSKARSVPPGEGFPGGSTGARCARPTAWPGCWQAPGRRSAAARGLPGKPCHLRPHRPLEIQ